MIPKCRWSIIIFSKKDLVTRYFSTKFKKYRDKVPEHFKEFIFVVPGDFAGDGWKKRKKQPLFLGVKIENKNVVGIKTQSFGIILSTGSTRDSPSILQRHFLNSKFEALFSTKVIYFGEKIPEKY